MIWCVFLVRFILMFSVRESCGPQTPLLLLWQQEGRANSVYTRWTRNKSKVRVPLKTHKQH